MKQSERLKKARGGSGFQAIAPKLLFDVGGGFVSGGCSGSAALQLVGGKKLERVWRCVQQIIEWTAAVLLSA